MQNIGASNAEDAFYRYKMPKLQARIEGRGNGIKTNVVNNVDIAKALERPPEYIVKYYGCELGAQTKFDVKTGTSIVNGAHDTSKLCELLEGFIKKYVQCYSCGNPETVFKLRKDSIFLKCKACGAISEVDMRHKLNGYILKHPPPKDKKSSEEKVKKAMKEKLKGVEDLKEKKDKKDKKEKKEKGGKKKDADAEAQGDSPPEDQDEAEEEEVEEEEDDDSTVWATDTSSEAMQRRAAEQLSTVTAQMVTLGSEEADRAARRIVEEEARRAEEAKLAEEAARKLALTQQQAPAQQEAAESEDESESDGEIDEEELVEELSELASASSEGKRDPVKVAEVLRKIPIPDGTIGLMRVLYRALLGSPEPSAKLSSLAVKHEKLLKALAEDATQQMAQLLALEYLLVKQLTTRIKEVPLVLKALYDAEIVEEDVVLAWFSKVGAGRVVNVAPAEGKLVRDAARPFVEWLQQSSDEDESEDDEDESDEE